MTSGSRRKIAHDVSVMMREYHETGMIGEYEPKDEMHARRISLAIASDGLHNKHKRANNIKPAKEI